MKTAKRFVLIAMVAAWFAGSVALIAQEKDHQTLSGVVSNSHCGLKHSTGAAGEAGCVNMCVKNNNASYALVVGDKLYTLDGMTAEVAKLAGQHAKLTGHVKGNSMQVEKVVAGK